jgi:hypothetical protein
MGDTAAIIQDLRHRSSRGLTAQEWCTLGTLLARTSSSGTRDGLRRHEAVRAFDRGLRQRQEPRCLYELALVREKQGARTEALRMLQRVGRLLRERPQLASTAFQAELLYRRALLVDDWLRNFDYLVSGTNLPVSTPTCLTAAGYFCENFRRPREFNTRRPTIEVHARFEWDTTLVAADSATIGIFVHDRNSGNLVNRGTAARRTRLGTVSFGTAVPVTWGSLQVSVEGFAFASQAAGQKRDNLAMAAAPDTSLSLSDLLLGDEVSGPSLATRREDVRFAARPDSVYQAGAPIAIYWEVYGLPGGPASDTLTQLRVTLTARNAAGRSVPARIVQGAGRLVGVGGRDVQSIEWEVERPDRPAVLPLFVTLGAPEDDGTYRLSISVTDLASARTAATERVIAVSHGN